MLPPTAARTRSWTLVAETPVVKSFQGPILITGAGVPAEALKQAFEFKF